MKKKAETMSMSALSDQLKFRISDIKDAILAYKSQITSAEMQLAIFENALKHASPEPVELYSEIPLVVNIPQISLSESVQKKRHMSAAGRKRIGDAARQRWAAKRAGSKEVSAPIEKKKRHLSAAARKAISKASKRRWARVNREKRAALRG